VIGTKGKSKKIKRRLNLQKSEFFISLIPHYVIDKIFET